MSMRFHITLKRNRQESSLLTFNPLHHNTLPVVFGTKGVLSKEESFQILFSKGSKRSSPGPLPYVSISSTLRVGILRQLTLLVHPFDHYYYVVHFVIISSYVSLYFYLSL